MSRKIEKYLSERRTDLDVESPDDDVIWGGIKKKLHEGSAGTDKKSLRISFIHIRNFAAASIIIFFLGYITSDIISKKQKISKQVALSSISSELGRKEMLYKATVKFKTDEVRSYSHSQDSVIRQLFLEIKKLDTIYSRSMHDLKVLGPDERVINTIFATYEQKIRLLELIILETNKSESHEKFENNKKTDKTTI